ncbi:MAG: hypothetical protein A2W93_13675 [Bacteroidetes bacterium GWF2_43_63]|nr:MAG: hypothetical protein A2W94_03870 [Bacteroidetes bacterium GWE2_42_42]OFY55038.1 MAG: hypothetical protein A2W93_13675 [Bacteroidetes bacterium GWF2_43_63]HBG69575.1 hypothetical protein [Bacteroidales bacterium]HCB60686.1 hypothetical protein [Bacteroidales bacterium]HCY24010.1 hypothetical protein [Bacteroidales bacterium]
MKFQIKNLRRKLFGFLSFSTALFVFQACYGAPQDESTDVLFHGTIVSDSTDFPVPGIKVNVNSDQYALTDSTGTFSFYVPAASQYHLILTDADTLTDGHYLDKDTVLSDISTSGITIRIDPK